MISSVPQLPKLMSRSKGGFVSSCILILCIYVGTYLCGTSRRYEQHQSTLHVGSRLYYLNSTYQRKTTKTSPRSLIHPSSRRYCTRRLQVPKICMPYSKVSYLFSSPSCNYWYKTREKKHVHVRKFSSLSSETTCSSCVVQGRTTWKNGGFFSCLWPLFEG